MRKIKSALAAVLLISSFSALNSSAGELLDWLEEVQFARSYAQVSINSPLLLHVNQEECMQILPNISDLESHLLLDRNGQPRSQAEIINVINQIECIFLAIDELHLQFEAEQVIQNFVDVISGAEVNFAEGAFLDGTKQSLRVALSPLITLLYQFSSLEEGEPFSLFGDDTCTILRDWITQGSTFELQMTGFFSIASTTIPDFDGTTRGLCYEARPSNEGALIAGAKSGDLDSALHLAELWRRDVLELNRNGADRTAIEAEIKKFELLIIQHTEKYPLLTKAAVLPLFLLNSYLIGN